VLGRFYTASGLCGFFGKPQRKLMLCTRGIFMDKKQKELIVSGGKIAFSLPAGSQEKLFYF
jgi:hypothetical protein